MLVAQVLPAMKLARRSPSSIVSLFLPFWLISSLCCVPCSMESQKRRSYVRIANASNIYFICISVSVGIQSFLLLPSSSELSLIWHDDTTCTLSSRPLRNTLKKRWNRKFQKSKRKQRYRRKTHKIAQKAAIIETWRLVSQRKMEFPASKWNEGRRLTFWRIIRVHMRRARRKDFRFSRRLGREIWKKHEERLYSRRRVETKLPVLLEALSSSHEIAVVTRASRSGMRSSQEWRNERTFLSFFHERDFLARSLNDRNETRFVLIWSYGDEETMLKIRTITKWKAEWRKTSKRADILARFSGRFFTQRRKKSRNAADQWDWERGGQPFFEMLRRAWRRGRLAYGGSPSAHSYMRIPEIRWERKTWTNESKWKFVRERIDIEQGNEEKPKLQISAE